MRKTIKINLKIPTFRYFLLQAIKDFKKTLLMITK